MDATEEIKISSQNETTPESPKEKESEEVGTEEVREEPQQVVEKSEEVKEGIEEVKENIEDVVEEPQNEAASEQDENTKGEEADQVEELKEKVTPPRPALPPNRRLSIRDILSVGETDESEFSVGDSHRSRGVSLFGAYLPPSALPQIPINIHPSPTSLSMKKPKKDPLSGFIDVEDVHLESPSHRKK